MTDGVVVLDEREFVRTGLVATLEHLPGVAWVRASPSWRELGSDCKDDVSIVVSSAEVLTTDVGHIRWDSPKARLLCLIREDRVEHYAPAAALDADGYLLERDLTSDLISGTLIDLRMDSVPMPSQLREYLLLAHAAKGHRAPHLTGREHDILKLMAEGRSNKDIARLAQISIQGVKHHVSSILAKLDCSNRTIAVMTAVRAGIVPCPCCGQDDERRARGLGALLD
jgi:DNA-binding NarL/FixJ family response regulator